MEVQINPKLFVKNIKNNTLKIFYMLQRKMKELVLPEIWDYNLQEEIILIF